MIYLLLSISCSSLIYLCFKAIKTQGANNFSVILFNYWVAGITGVSTAYYFAPDFSIQMPLLAFGALLGFLFISIFLVMSNTTQQFGVGTASVASKMSVVIPVLIGLLAYQEGLNVYKGIGLMIALLSVYLVTYTKDKKQSNRWWLPVILFIGSGTIDSLLKFGQETFKQEGLSFWLIPLIFMFAAIYGTAYGLGKRKIAITQKEVKLGFTLGIINYGSMIFLLLTLAIPSLESSTIFPLNNVGIVTLSAILGYILYKEKMSWLKILGIVLAVTATLLIGFN